MERRKAVKALKILFIGELFLMISYFCELSFLYEPLAFLSLLSLIGMIIILVSIVKLFKANKFFLISFLTVCISFLFGVVEAILVLTKCADQTIQTYESVANVLSKAMSMAFIFGVIRGCSKVAMGKANTRFANIMTIVNLIGKGSAILFSILDGFYKSSNPTLSNAFSIVAMTISLGVEIFFVTYVFRAYKKSKNTLKEN